MTPTLDAPVTGLPRRDQLMTVIMIGAMLFASAVSALIDFKVRFFPAYVLMPITLGLMYAAYTFSIARAGRKQPQTAVKMATFIGRTQSMMGAVMLLGHLGLMAAFSGVVEPVSKAVFLRVFMAMMALALIVTHNQMPKFLDACVAGGAQIMPRGKRLAGWLGVICGLAMVVVAFAAPFDLMTPIYMVLAFIPTAVIMGSCLIWWLDRRRSAQP